MARRRPAPAAVAADRRRPPASSGAAAERRRRWQRRRPRPTEHAGRRHPGPRQPRRRAARQEPPEHDRATARCSSPTSCSPTPTGRPGASSSCATTRSLLHLRLENFRDYDLHFVTPIVIGPGDIARPQPRLRDRPAIRRSSTPGTCGPEAGRAPRRCPRAGAGAGRRRAADARPHARVTAPTRSRHRRPGHRPRRAGRHARRADAARVPHDGRRLPERAVLDALDLGQRPLRRVLVRRHRTSSVADRAPPRPASSSATWTPDARSGCRSRPA